MPTALGPGDPQGGSGDPGASKKGDLASWWRTFKKTTKREEEKGELAAKKDVALRKAKKLKALRQK